MANYSNLKAAIEAAIKTNGNQEITGQVLQDVLTSVVSVLGANYTFTGVATPATNPGTPDQNVFYFATEAGTYSNFGGIRITGRSLFVFLWNGTWTNIEILSYDDYFQDIDALVTQFEQQLRQMLEDYQPIVIEGDVTNAPDEEDLTSVDNLLRFKNRNTLYGMGCIYLRRELGFAEQLRQENTIYVIRYDYTLTADVTIPANCVLKFDGGSISGEHTLTGNSTKIQGIKNCLLCGVGGTFSSYEIDFFIPNYENQSTRINEILDLARRNDGVVSFGSHPYTVDETLDFSKVAIFCNGATFVGTMDDESAVIEISEYHVQNRIQDLVVDCNNKNNIGLQLDDATSFITNIQIINVHYLGISTINNSGITLNKFTIIGSEGRYAYCRGIYSTGADNKFSEGVIKFCAIGIDSIGGDFINIHIWGYPGMNGGNTNIDFLHRHTPVRISAMVFDTPLADVEPSDTRLPEIILEDNANPAKQVFRGGCGLLNLGDEVSLSNCCITTNFSIDPTDYPKPIFIRNVVNRAITDIGTTKQYGYDITYLSDDNLTAYFKHNIFGAYKNTIGLFNSTIGFRPEDFGAAGDGTTDDTWAFKKALNRGNIILSSGKTYRITTSLSIENKYIISEDIAKGNETLKPIINYDSVDKISASKSAFVGVKFTTPSAGGYDAFKAYIIGDSNIIENCTFDKGRWCIEGSGLSIKGCQFYNTVQQSIRNIDNSTIIGCIFYECNEAIRPGTNGNNIISECFITKCLRGMYIYQSPNNIVSNNNISESDTYAISIEASVKNTINGNVFVGNGKTPTIDAHKCHITQKGDCNGTIIVGNIFKEKNDVPLYCFRPENTTINLIGNSIIGGYHTSDVYPYGTVKQLRIGNIGLTDNNPDLPISGGTSDRPSNPPKGFSYFDTDLSPKKPIWWNGTAWVDATGATV